MRTVILLGAALLLAGEARAQAVPASRTYDAVVDGMNCRQQGSGRLDCSYAVGEGLRFSIVGIGQDDAVVTFAQIDSSRGYVAAFSTLHGCVVVKPATAGDSSVALAFVSPRDGRVYRVWQHCKQPPRR